MIKNNEILIELLEKQRKNIPYEVKLQYLDLKRISKYIYNSIFDDECCLWYGYITKTKNNSYINFYYNKKKYTLQRLLYINYIGDLSNSEYIKFKCCNKGKCCNINHFYKINENNADNNTNNNIENNADNITNNNIDNITNNNTDNNTNNNTDNTDNIDNIDNNKHIIIF
jgi:hypothetical protein